MKQASRSSRSPRAAASPPVPPSPPSLPAVRINHVPRWLARLIVRRWGTSGLGVIDCWGALRTAQAAVQQVRPSFDWNHPGSMRLPVAGLVFTCEHHAHADRLAFALEHIARSIGCGWAVTLNSARAGTVRGFLFQYEAAAIVDRVLEASRKGVHRTPVATLQKPRQRKVRAR